MLVTDVAHRDVLDRINDLFPPAYIAHDHVRRDILRKDASRSVFRGLCHKCMGFLRIGPCLHFR